MYAQHSFQEQRFSAPLPAATAAVYLDRGLEMLPTTAPAKATPFIPRARYECSRVDVRLLLGFQRHLEAQGASPTATGPDIMALWAKSPLHASVAKQHRPSGARESLPALVEGGQGIEAHIEAAANAQHPFAAEPVLERDLLYAVEAYGAMGPAIREARDDRLEVLRSISRAALPLDRALLSARHVSIEGAPGARPMFVAIVAALLAWPDTGLPESLAEGFPIAGDLAAPGTFRPTLRTHVGRKADTFPGELLLGASAEAVLDDTEANTTPSKHDGTIWGET